MPATIEQLTGEVDALTEKVTQLSNLLALFQVNGLADAFDGSGNQTFGGGVMRLDKTGIQIKSPSATAVPAVYWLPEFSSTPDAYVPRGEIRGSAALGVISALIQPIASLITGTYFSHFYGSVSTYGDNKNAESSIAAVTPTIPAAIVKCISIEADVAGTQVTRHVQIIAPLYLDPFSSDPTTVLDGYLWYRSDLFRFRAYSNGIVGNLGMEIQSAAAAAVATGGTITTAGVSAARVAPTGAVTGVILAVGTTGGQMCQVVNESSASRSVTFAVAATSNVANGVSSVIAGLRARSFVWNSVTALWYPCI